MGIYQSVGVFCLLLLSSCASYRPVASSYSTPDYNQRIQVKGAKFKKTPNAIGVTVGVGLPVAGAVGGYYLGLVKDYTIEEGRVSSPVKNVVLGALVGTGLSAISSAIAGYGKHADGDLRTWARKAGDYILVRESGNDIVLISPSAESNYIVKNLQDVRDFALAFPDSPNTERVIDMALACLPRENMPALVELFPRSPSMDKMAGRYIVESQSFAELDEALKRYPSYSINREQLYLERIKNGTDAISFKKMFPSSRFSRQAVVSAFAARNDKSVMEKMAKAFGEDIKLKASDLREATQSHRKNYYEGMYNLASCKDMKQFGTFNDNYSWLTFTGKSEVVLDRAWALAERNCKKGSEMLSQMGTIVGTNYGQGIGINAAVLNQYVKKKYEEAVKRDVEVLSIKVINSISDEFKRWKSASYAAGVVGQNEVSYLIYGEVKNNSRFDLPLSLSFGGVLYQKVSAGSFMDGLVAWADRIQGKQQPSNKRVVSMLTISDYLIPVLEAGTSCIYATQVTLKEQTLKSLGLSSAAGGGNLGDIVKLSAELALEDVKVHAAFTENTPTQEQVKRQSEWQALAKNGLPAGKLMDFVRNIEYRQSTWDEKWAEIKRRAASRPASASSSSSSKSSDSSLSDNRSYQSRPEGKNMHSCRVQIYFREYKSDYGEVFSDSKITAYWGSNGLFGSLFHADFKTDKKGWATISWPADEGDAIIEIYFHTGIIFKEEYEILNVELKPGSTHRFCADSYKKKY